MSYINDPAQYMSQINDPISTINQKKKINDPADTSYLRNLDTNIDRIPNIKDVRLKKFPIYSNNKSR